MINLDKIQNTCSNVYLIDENLCLSNSYQILNTNFQTLSNALVNLDAYGNYFSSIFTLFAANSSRWNRSISNWETLSGVWMDSESKVKSLSSTWQTNATVIYSKILSVVNYYANPNSSQTAIRNWLNANFINYISDNQEIHVNVYLSHSFGFTWRYVKQYYENCIPPQTGTTGRCPVPRLPGWGCNRTVAAGRAYGGCQNATSFCRANNITLQGIAALKCSNGGAKNVRINFALSSTDKTICRAIRLRYKRIGGSFNLI